MLHNVDCFDFMNKTPDGSFDLVLTDIPYGEVNRKSGGLRGLDKGAADTFDNANIQPLVAEIARVTSGCAYMFCGTMQISAICEAFVAEGMTTRVGAWSKTNPSPMNGSRLWVSGLEFCVYARKPRAVHNEHCQKALWECASVPSKIHPTQKPVKLFERLIRASTPDGGSVFDPFMGSGTTALAAMNTGRSWTGCELSSEFYAAAMERIGLL